MGDRRDTDMNIPPPGLDPRVISAFLRDTEKVSRILKAISDGGEYPDEVVGEYVVRVHAMKSALANVGEPELSKEALRLETAGREKDLGVIKSGTRPFLEALDKVAERLKPKDEPDAAEDKAFVRKKLLDIAAACAGYDKKSAKDAMAELKARPVSRATRECLSLISGHLLHSDFNEAENVAVNCAERL